MTPHSRSVFLLLTGMLLAAAGAGFAAQAQDRFTLKSPNGIAFAEFKGYDTWQAVAPSVTEDGIKVIFANPVMINAYKNGSGSGKAFPDGSMIAKIEWAKTPNSDSPYDVNVPGALKSVSFIEKDARRFPDTNGWGYAQFRYDAASRSFTPTGTGTSFGKTECHVCHTGVKAADYIFTHYAPR